MQVLHVPWEKYGINVNLYIIQKKPAIEANALNIYKLANRCT